MHEQLKLNRRTTTDSGRGADSLTALHRTWAASNGCLIQEVRLSTSNRLPGVDGLRAVAALWVVLFHISALSQAQFPQVPGLDLFMKSGSTGVSLFLVLSGFCLYLPFAGGRTGRFKARDFFLRRCRRLMPAYYASLAVALIVTVATAVPLGQPPLTAQEIAWQLGTHATLTHSLFSDTFYALNGAYWSLGLEWQLYLGLPLLISGIRRFGLTRTVFVVVLCNIVYRFALGAAISQRLLPPDSPLATVVLPNQIFGRWAEFAFGMVAAELYASQRLKRWARFVPMLLLAIFVMIPVAILSTRFDISHIIYGGLFFTLLCAVVTSDNIASRALSWRPLVALGTMSYSLYLVHQPVIQSFVSWIHAYSPDTAPREVFLMLVLLTPAIFLLAWLLFVSVERRTIGSHAAGALMPSVSWPGLLSFRLLARPVVHAEPTGAALLEARTPD
jgi:peptidoglycan/LPS O-acetylase OafA/YrhL